jgi:hypothetical protein
MKLLKWSSNEFSTWNRRKKSKFVEDFISSRNVKSCLVVGGNPNANAPGFVNLIEHAIRVSLSRRGDSEFVISGIEPNGQGWENWIQADGRDLPFESGAFELVFSNAVIEHVGDESDQLKFIMEHERVGKNWILTTPNRLFPIEGHTQALFIHMRGRWKHPLFSRLLSKKDLLKILPPGTQIKGYNFSPTFICYKFQD